MEYKHCGERGAYVILCAGGYMASRPWDHEGAPYEDPTRRYQGRPHLTSIVRQNFKVRLRSRLRIAFVLFSCLCVRLCCFAARARTFISEAAFASNDPSEDR